MKIDSRVLVSGAQSLRIAGNSPAKPLLASSDKALSLRDLSALLDAEPQGRADRERAARQLHAGRRSRATEARGLDAPSTARAW